MDQNFYSLFNETKIKMQKSKNVIVKYFFNLYIKTNYELKILNK